jgi:hypothetical protein
MPGNVPTTNDAGSACLSRYRSFVSESGRHFQKTINEAVNAAENGQVRCSLVFEVPELKRLGIVPILRLPYRVSKPPWPITVDARSRSFSAL